MTYFQKPIAIVALVSFLLSGCVSMSAVPAGVPLKAETAYSVTPSTSWTRLPTGLNPTKGSALTQDGVPLGAVYLVTVKNDKPMIINTQSSKNSPRYTTGGTALEHIDFLKTSMNLFGYLNVSPTNVRPTEVDGISGTQFGLTGKYPNGLKMQGDAIMVETEKGLNIVLYAAPATHYYEKYKLDANAIMKSIDLD